MHNLRKRGNNRLGRSRRLLAPDVHKLQAALGVGGIFGEPVEAEGARRIGAQIAPGGEEDAVPKAREEERTDAD